MSHRFAIRKLAEAQFGVNLTGNRPKFRMGLKEVVNFSDRRQDVERLSVDALPVWGAGPREAACLLVLVCYGQRHVKRPQHATNRSRKNAATTSLTEAPSRQSITLAPTNLVRVEEANRYVYGNDVESGDAVDKIRKVGDLPDLDATPDNVRFRWRAAS